MDGFEKEGGMNNFFHKRFSLPLSSFSHILPFYSFSQRERDEGEEEERKEREKEEEERREKELTLIGSEGFRTNKLILIQFLRS